jgi:hypothetical protein
MPRRSQLRLILHGAIFMLVTMTVGFFEFRLVSLRFGSDDSVRQALRQWHAILMTTGIWMIATGAGLPLLELTSRGITWLVWMLVFSGYTFMLSLVVLLLGFWAHPEALKETIQTKQIHALGWYGWINVGLIIINGVTSMIPAGIIVRGAVMGMRHTPIDDIH